MLGHHDVADEFEVILASRFAQSPNERVSRWCGAQKRQAAVATERDEMQMAETIGALQAFRHGDPRVRKGPNSPTLTRRAWGTLKGILSGDVP